LTFDYMSSKAHSKLWESKSLKYSKSRPEVFVKNHWVDQDK